MRVEVTMHGNLRRLLPGGVASIQLDLRDGATVAEVIEQLQGQHEIWVAAIGDAAVPLSTRLEDGVALDFFPHLEGG